MPKEKIKTKTKSTDKKKKSTKSTKSSIKKSAARSFHFRPQTTSEASHRGLRVLLLGLLLLGMGQSLFFAVLPPLARELGLNEAQTAIIFSLSALAWVFFSPFWGKRSDTWGRRNVMVIGIAGFAVSTLLVTIVIYGGLNEWYAPVLILPLLIIARSFFGIFGSGTMPAAQAYMADRTTRARRAKGASMLTASFGIGNILGPGFAASLIVFGFLSPFIFIGIIGLVLALLIFWMVPEKHRVQFNQDKTQKMKFFAKPLRIFILLGCLASYAQSVLIQLTAFYFIDTLALSTAEGTQLVGIGFTFMAMAALFAQFGIIQRFEPPVRSLLVYSALILVVGFLGMAVSNNFASLVLFLGLCGFGFGLMRPGLMAAASLSVGRQNQGAAAGAINATAAIGHVINPFTGAIIYAYYPSVPFLIVAVSMILFFALALWHPRMRTLASKNLALDEDYMPAPHTPMSGLQMMEQAEKPKPAKAENKKLTQKVKKLIVKNVRRKKEKK